MTHSQKNKQKLSAHVTECTCKSFLIETAKINQMSHTKLVRNSHSYQSKIKEEWKDTENEYEYKML